MLRLNIVIPIYNEQEDLVKSINILHDFLTKNFKDFAWQIWIANNASTDKSPQIAKFLTKKLEKVYYKSLDLKGRGRAVKKVWLETAADIYCYMDVDLSTSLQHLRPLVSAIKNGYDVAIGSRLLKRSKVKDRTLKREIISRCYNFLIKTFFGVRFSDAQCGFKAISKSAARRLLPYVVDNQWFFDSELLILAEKLGYKIYEEPATWIDNPGSTVRILPTAIGDLKGLIRLFLTRPWREIKIKRS